VSGVSKDAGPSVASWFETRFALLTMRGYHLFRKFSGNPGRGQSIAISSPLPDSVM
jgi:hypothetical protein